MKRTLNTRNTIINASRELIIQRGFNAMTIEMVCTKSKVTKGGFFHYFNSKLDLGECVLECFWNDVVEKYSAADYHKENDAIKKIAKYIDFTIELYQDPIFNSGCLLAVYTSELKESFPTLYEKSIPYFEGWRLEVSSLIQQASLASNAKIDIDTWTDAYVSSLEGALVVKKALSDPTIFLRVLGLFKEQLLLKLGSPSSSHH
jgi:TetR/AcrR family transcriptional regulator, transcriptional repressor for nem operon